MAIPRTVRRFLDQHQATFKVISHSHTECSMETAEAAHISGERIAKGVLLKDRAGYVLAVLPATHALRLEAVRGGTGRALDLAPESDLASVFPDCVPGAVPAVGPAYGLSTIVDEALVRQPRLYFEAGDHAELVRVIEPGFEDLLGKAQYFSFSDHVH